MLQFSVTYRIYHLRLDLSTVKKGSLASGLSGRSFMRRLMDAVRVKVGFCDEYGAGVYWKMPADLVPPTPAPSEAKGQLPRSGTFAARNAPPKVRFVTKIKAIIKYE